jgi:serine/threonine protein kinase
MKQLLLTMPRKTNKMLKESMTKGIGTAAYCAPEQVSSTLYDSSADIFSIGLILLELICLFGTEHERIQTFHDCRRGVLPSAIQEAYPEVTKIIRWCTDPNPRLRPSAKQLMTMPFLRARVVDSSLYMESLSQKLDEKEMIIQKLQSELLEKDKLIEEMQAEILKLKSSSIS